MTDPTAQCPVTGWPTSKQDTLGKALQLGLPVTVRLGELGVEPGYCTMQVARYACLQPTLAGSAAPRPAPAAVGCGGPAASMAQHEVQHPRPASQLKFMGQ